VSRRPNEDRSAPAAPDVTDAVLERLGFERCSPAVARRRRRQRIALRGGMLLATVGALGLGSTLLRDDDRIRRPVGPTIDAALLEDLDHQRDHFGVLMDSLRHRTGRLISVPAEESPPGPPDESVDDPLTDEIGPFVPEAGYCTVEPWKRA